MRISDWSSDVALPISAGGRAPGSAALEPRPSLLPGRLRPHLRGQRLLQLRLAPPAERLLLAPPRRRRLPAGGNRHGHHRRLAPEPLIRGRAGPNRGRADPRALFLGGGPATTGYRHAIPGGGRSPPGPAHTDRRNGPY